MCKASLFNFRLESRLFKIPYLPAPSFYQPSPGTACGDIGSGKIIQDVLGNKPGIMNFHCRQIPLSAEPFNCFWMDLEYTASFYDIKIIIPRFHNVFNVNIALLKQY